MSELERYDARHGGVDRGVIGNYQKRREIVRVERQIEDETFQAEIDVVRNRIKNRHTRLMHEDDLRTWDESVAITLEYGTTSGDMLARARAKASPYSAELIDELADMSNTHYRRAMQDVSDKIRRR